jgi:hypothetical protein
MSFLGSRLRPPRVTAKGIFVIVIGAFVLSVAASA